MKNQARYDANQDSKNPDMRPGVVLKEDISLDKVLRTLDFEFKIKGLDVSVNIHNAKVLTDWKDAAVKAAKTELLEFIEKEYSFDHSGLEPVRIQISMHHFKRLFK
jgi:hypothetical protein